MATIVASRAATKSERNRANRMKDKRRVDRGELGGGGVVSVSWSGLVTDVAERVCWVASWAERMCSVAMLDVATETSGGIIFVESCGPPLALSGMIEDAMS